MPEDTTTTTPGATPAVTSANSQPSTGTTPDPLAGDGTTINLEEARKLRSEAANLRKRLKEYEDAKEQARIAALDETQQVQARAEKTAKEFQQYQQEAESKLKAYQQQLIAAQVERAAFKLGIIDPELAAWALEKSSMLTFGDDGMPENVDEALKALLKQRPHLAPKPAEPDVPPAQTAAPAALATPALPAMNPGRTSINQPALPPGRIPRLTDTGLFKSS